MALVEWDSRLSVGIAELDEEHAGLVQLINELFEAMSLGRGAEVLPDVLQGLDTYTQLHFAHEERLMREHAYPELDAHAAEHQRLVAAVRELRARAAREGAAAVASTEVLSFLKNWLLKHIHGTDKRYGPFLNARNVR